MQRPSLQRGERERERDTHTHTCMRKIVSAIVWETWWCSISTKFLTFQFFYYCVQVSARCVEMKIIIFFPLLFVEVIVKIPMCSF